MKMPVGGRSLGIPSLFVLGALATLSLGCQATPPPTTPAANTERESELEAVRETVTRVTHEIDAKRWDELRKLYADEVRTDYTSLFGGTPVKQSGDALIQGWKSALAKVHTHHQLGPVVVKLGDGTATATCQVRGLHHADGAPGGTDWEVLGHYVFELSKRADGGWRIHDMTILTRVQTGNTKLLQEAAR
jgi:ketosteroid isomerase-like protein